jgi:hypothetical protein
MNTKSTIQLVAEVLTAKEEFAEHLATLNERYNIRNNVFACDAHHNAEEITTGYYGEVATYDTLDEAMKNCNILLQGIRIHEGKYSIGNLYAKLSDVKEDLIIDLSNAQVL